MISNLKKYLKLILVALLIGLPIALLCFLTVQSIETSNLTSKVIYFNAVFFASIGWWYSLIGRAHDLKKFEVLPSQKENFLSNVVDKTTGEIYGIIFFNIAGVVITILCLLFEANIQKFNLAFLSLYFLSFSFLLLALFPSIKSRIENASSALIKKEAEEKRKIEILKSLKSGIDKFEKEPNFENYNKVITVKQTKQP